MTKRWMPIPAKPQYLVSSDGEIRSPSGRIMKPGLAGAGYPAISLGRATRRYVHRCVVEAFWGEIPPELEVNHKNGVKTDNRLENLEVVSKGQNQKHSWRVLKNFQARKLNTQGANHPSARLTEEDVLLIRGLSKRGIPVTKIADVFQIDRAHVNAIVSRRRWACVT